MLPDVSQLMNGFDGNIDEAAGQLIPLKGVFESKNSILMINALEVIVENEINAFTTAGSSFKAFSNLLQILQNANTGTINSNVLYGLLAKT